MRLKEEIIQAYHGSPYQFDRFDMSKIGSGDGLNKYGHGLYFADREDTAEYYAKELSIGDNKETGFNIYEVTLNGNFYHWDHEIPHDVHQCVIDELNATGKEDDAEEMAREAEEYGDLWSMDSLYQWLEYVVGGKKNASEFLVGCGVDGVIAQSPAHEGNVIVIYNDQVIRIRNIKKLGENNDITEMIRREIWSMNEMVENQGFLAYHGSPQKINSFSNEFIGGENATDQEGPGIYFTTFYDDALGYAGNNGYVHTVKLSPRKLLDESSSDDINFDSVLWLIKQAPDWEDTAYNWSEDPESGAYEAAQAAIEYNDKEKDVFVQVWYDFYRYNAKEYADNMVQLGIDGIVIDKMMNDRSGKHIIMYNPAVIQLNDVEQAINEITGIQMQDVLADYTDASYVTDGGYAFDAISPQTVGESIEDYRSLSIEDIKNAINYIRNFDGKTKTNASFISDLYRNYLIGSQNIETALKVSDDDIDFFNKLMSVQSYLKKFGLLKEDLVYWGASDATKDEYVLGGEGISEGENEGINDAINEVGDVVGVDKEVADKVANYVSDKFLMNPPKYMGEGTFGYAYDTGNAVIKVTGDRSEAVDSLEIKGKNNERIANIFNVFHTDAKKKGGNDDLYVIVLEKLDTNPEIERVHNSLNAILEDNYDGQGIASIVIDEYVNDRYLWDKETKEDIKEVLKNHPKELKHLEGILAIADEVLKNNIASRDFISSKNLGYKKNGNLAFFDAGFGDYFKKPKNKIEKLKIGEGGDSLYSNAQGTVNPEDIAWDLQEMVLDSLANVITERIISWMPKAKAVKVKKNCRLGGKGDGTSDACNQGDISNLDIDDIKDDNSGKENKPNVAEENQSERYYVNEGSGKFDITKKTLSKLEESVTKWIKESYDNNMIKEADIMNLKDLPFKETIQRLGGRIFSVGGAVRDEFLGKESKDLDILITGIPMDKLERILAGFGKVDAVGKSFGVLKFKPHGAVEDIDVAIPRTETATGEGGHKGFDVNSDHTLSIEDDLRRRDFTFNAMARDIDGNLIDPFGGQQDLGNGLIKLVNPDAFSDDPLRMIRAIQFAARFSTGGRVFTIDPETENMIKQNAGRIKEIAGERILEELKKVVDKGGDPLYAADLLRGTGLFENIFGAKSPAGMENHWDNDAWNGIRTLGEFVFMLLHPITDKPADLFKTRLKGDIPTSKEIMALNKAWTEGSDDPIKNRVVVHNMFLNSPKSFESHILPDGIKNAVEELQTGKYPKSLKELQINGNDLQSLGLKGKEIGDALKKSLIDIYSDKVKNNKEDLLNNLGNTVS